jgi:hypothetical protein
MHGMAVVIGVSDASIVPHTHTKPRDRHGHGLQQEGALE